MQYNQFTLLSRYPRKAEAEAYIRKEAALMEELGAIKKHNGGNDRLWLVDPIRLDCYLDMREHFQLKSGARKAA